jgi:hypothetical protein
MGNRRRDVAQVLCTSSGTFILYFQTTRSIKLKAINLFVNSADELYGPITTIRRESCIRERIRWSAFALKPSDWERVQDMRAVISVRPSHTCCDSDQVSLTSTHRMRTTSSNYSLMNIVQRSGKLSRPLRSSRRRGRVNTTARNMPSIATQSKMASTKSTNIILVLMTSPYILLLLVSIFYVRIHRFVLVY